jgi:hypothetical protein
MKTIQHRIFGVVMQVYEGRVHRPPGLGRATDSSRRVAVRGFAASQHPSERRHRIQFPAELGEDSGRDEGGDEDSEPDANHGQNAITARPARNRVFPSKRSVSLEK